MALPILERATRLWLRLAEHHPPTAAHCQRVALALLRQLTLMQAPPETRLLGYVSGLLHDVGKLALPVVVLEQPGPIDPKVWARIRRHPVASERLVREAGMPEAVACAVRAHHERWDGGGYPDGLRCSAIPWLARGLCVLDALDVMVHGRPYQKGRSLPEAFAELHRGRGRQFDPQWVDRVVSEAPSTWSPVVARRRRATSTAHTPGALTRVAAPLG